jgi:hypothetical protein
VGGVGYFYFLTPGFNPGEVPMPSAPPRERLLTRQEVADLLHVKPQTLAMWAMHRRFLPVVKCGDCCRYRPSDVEQFINDRTEAAVQ